MLTAPSAAVDERKPLPRDGHWLSVSTLARERGVSKQAISKNLSRWASIGEPVSTRREGRMLLVNVAEYDARKGDLVDLGREQASRTKKSADESATNDPVYTREQARRMGYEADIKAIQLEKLRGNLVAVPDLADAAVKCGEALVRAIDQIAVRAEEVAAAVAKDGMQGARAALRQIARDLRARAAEEFARLPATAMNAAGDDGTADTAVGAADADGNDEADE